MSIKDGRPESVITMQLLKINIPYILMPYSKIHNVLGSIKTAVVNRIFRIVMVITTFMISKAV